MATEQEVAAQRARTDAVRDAVRKARSGGSSDLQAKTNDLKVASLSNEEEMLQRELNRLTGGSAPATAPTPAPAPRSSSPKADKGADTDQEG